MSTPSIEIEENPNTLTISQSNDLVVIDASKKGNNPYFDEQPIALEYSGVVGLRGFNSLRLSWTQNETPDHFSHTEVWRSHTDDINAAKYAGQTETNYFTDVVEPGLEYYYWFRPVSHKKVNGNFSDSYHAINTIGSVDGIKSLLQIDSIIVRIDDLEQQIANNLSNGLSNLSGSLTSSLNGIFGTLNESIELLEDNMVQITSSFEAGTNNSLITINDQLTIQASNTSALIQQIDEMTVSLGIADTERSAFIQNSQQAIADINGVLVSTREILEASILSEQQARTAAIDAERTLRVNEQELMAQDILNIDGRVTTETSERNAAITAERNIRINQFASVAEDISNISTGFATAESRLDGRIDSEVISRASALDVVNNSILELEGEVTTELNLTSANVTQQLNTFTENLSALALSFNELETDVANLNTGGNIDAALQQFEAALVAENGAITVSLETLETSLRNDLETKANVTSSINNLSATLSGDIGAAVNTLEGQLNDLEINLRADLIDALTFQNTIDNVNNAIGQETIDRAQAISDEADARSLDIQNLQSSIDGKAGQADIDASITSYNQTLVSPTGAIAQSVDNLEVTLRGDLATPADITASIDQNNIALVDTNGAITQAINNLNADLTGPTGPISAASDLAQLAKSTADGAASAEAALRVRVENVEAESSASVGAISDLDALTGQLESRAFLNVSSVTGGVATVTGLEANSTNNSLKFRGDILSFTDTNNVVQLYYSNNKWNFAGNLVAASGTFSGNLSAAGGTFTGNLVAAGGTFSGELSAATGTFAGDISAATGTFNGIVSGELSSPVVKMIGTNVMKIEDINGFSPPHNFTLWKGPRLLLPNGQPDYTALNKNNALVWEDDQGGAYFGGTLSAGIFKVAVRTPVLSLNPEVETAIFTTNGGSKKVTVSFNWSGYSEGYGTAPDVSGANISATVSLYRSNGGGSFNFVNSFTVTGSVNTFDPYGGEPGLPDYAISETAGKTVEFTDNDTSTLNVVYKAVVTIQSRYHGIGNISSQELGIISIEE